MLASSSVLARAQLALVLLLLIGGVQPQSTLTDTACGDAHEPACALLPEPQYSSAQSTPFTQPTRSLLAASSADAVLAIAYVMWCASNPACDSPGPLTFNLNSSSPLLPDSINLPFLVNGTRLYLPASPASGLMTPVLGTRSSGPLCTPQAPECYLEARLPVQQSSLKIRSTYICFQIQINTAATVNTTAATANTTAAAANTTLAGFPNGTGPVYTVTSRPVDNTISCRSTSLGPIFVAFYYPPDSLTELDKYTVVENNPGAAKYLTLDLQFTNSPSSMTPAEQEGFFLDVRKSAALQMAYHAPGANTSLLVGNVQVATLVGSTLRTRLYSHANTSDRKMCELWQRVVATDADFLFGSAFAEKYGEVYAGAGLNDKQSLRRKKLMWALLGVSSVVLSVGAVVWFWRSIVKTFKQKVGG